MLTRLIEAGVRMLRSAATPSPLRTKPCRHEQFEYFSQNISARGTWPANAVPSLRRPISNQASLDLGLDERRVEPNFALGQAMRYMLNHWKPLTLFLRQPGAPLDNNICERALKKAIMHRKNSLFFKTQNGADVGDIYMSLIYTCELNDVNPAEYLTELQRHADRLAANSADWMPWTCRRTLERLAADSHQIES